MRKKVIISIVFAGLLAAAGGVWALVGTDAVPPLVYTGTLSKDGKPVATPTAVKVRVVDAQGAIVCPATSPVWTDKDTGAFSVAFDDACSQAVADNKAVSSEVIVVEAGVDLPQGPVQIGSVPYALRAVGAESAKVAAAAQSATGELAAELGFITGAMSELDKASVKKAEVSTLVALAGFTKAADVDAKIGAQTAGFAKGADLDAKIAAQTAGFAKTAEVDSKITDKTAAFITGADVDAKVAAQTAALAKVADVPQIAADAGYAKTADVAVTVAAQTAPLAKASDLEALKADLQKLKADLADVKAKAEAPSVKVTALALAKYGASVDFQASGKPVSGVVVCRVFATGTDPQYAPDWALQVDGVRIAGAERPTADGAAFTRPNAYPGMAFVLSTLAAGTRKFRMVAFDSAGKEYVPAVAPAIKCDIQIVEFLTAQ